MALKTKSRLVDKEDNNLLGIADIMFDNRFVVKVFLGRGEVILLD